MKGLVKVAPIIVIVACLASLFFSHKLSGIKDELVKDKEQLGKDLGRSQAKVQEVEANLADVEQELATSKNEASEAKAKVAALNLQITQKDKELESGVQEVAKLNGNIAELKADLALAEKAVSLLKDKTESVEFLEAEDLKKQIDAITEENTLLSEKVSGLTAERDKLKDEVLSFKETPAGTRGHVALTEPDWNLVVLDIGSQDKVQRDAEFLLYRGDSLVAKARITKVNPDNSIAELLPDFTVETPEEGDLAVLAETKKM